MKGDGGRRLEELAVESRKNSDVVVGAGRRAHDPGVLVNGLQKLAWKAKTVGIQNSRPDFLPTYPVKVVRYGRYYT